MKKFFMTILAASMMLLGTNLSAQEWTAGGGFTSMNFTGSDKDLFGLDEAFPGFYFGASYDYAFSPIEGLTVEPGVYIQHYGKECGWRSAEKSYHANYVNVPINLKYQLPIEGNFTITAFTGPRFNFGIGGNMFSKGDTYMGLKLSDAQWGLGACAMVQDAVQIRLGYDFGLTKCLKDNKDLGFDDMKIYRNTLYVGIGFAF